MVEIDAMRRSDWPAVRAVYAQGIATGQATFEERPPTWAGWDRDHLQECRLVARRDGRVIGFAGLRGVSTRDVYCGVAEVSLYVAAAERGGGVGRALGEAVVAASERAGIWTLEGWVFPENRVSLALCEALGCRVVGVRERLGRMGDRWRDVVLVERRSRAV
ncbi:MAG: GNAT family N-acetyltransferase [Solirubrobacterales bacterium]